MAIPHWTEPPDDSPPDAERLDETSATFDALSNPIRLSVVAILADAREPVTYGALQAATGVDDNGQLNYHLRELRGPYVERTRRGYVLTERGEAAAGLLARDDL